MPKLSIIIPTFNSAATIQRCLHSIRMQTFNDYEIVIQDGGSSDGTVELIQEFLRENLGGNLKLAQEPDHGPYDAMNKAVRRAGGEWLYFLGSDDELYDQNILGTVLLSREAADFNVVYGNVQVVGNAGWAADGAIYDGPFDLRKLLDVNICHQAIFYRAVFVAEVGAYNPNYIILADWDFNMRCWAKGQFSYIEVIVAKFHGGGISTQARPDPKFEADVTQNVMQYFNLSPTDPLINSRSFCGKRIDDARRASRMTPRRVFRALGRRLRITS